MTSTDPKPPETTSPELVRVPLVSLRAHALSANVMTDQFQDKLTANIARSGRYPPPIVRPTGNDSFEVLDGLKRLTALHSLGETHAWCVLWPCSDGEALLLLATLNSIHGDEVPGRRSQLIAALAEHESLAELARLLPEEEAELEQSLALLDFDLDTALAEFTAQAEAEIEDAPVLFSFAVPAEDADEVRRAVAAAAEGLTGMNVRGRALVVLANRFLEEEGPDDGR